ncbi:hypothetical protein ACPXB3_16825 [Gordonia sp. DT219]|uniref:hypothetical protein n=1 Tax=Gordonia sp. DT219 TaxID=3416658 RepID=UPI003CF3409C
MTNYPQDDFGLIRRDAALRRGISDAHRAAAVKRGGLIRLVPGVDVEPSEEFDGHEGAQKLHRLKAIAVSTSNLGAEKALPLSHASAASLHGLPLLKPDLGRVHVTTGRVAGGSIRSHRHLHAAPLEADELVRCDGLLVTSLERTAVDVATSGDFTQALTAFDQALRLGADRSLMQEILVRRRRRNAKIAERALRFASALADSVGESWSRAQIIDATLPIPRLQQEIVVASGRTYRTDFDWDWRLVGEFDGMTKYGRLRRRGESVADAVIREKLREDEIRDTGPMVVRWIWSDLERDLLIPRLRNRLVALGLAA